jgi:hypothetical protein
MVTAKETLALGRHGRGHPLNGNNRPLVTDKPVEFEKYGSRWKFETSGELPIIEEESMEYTSI